MWGIGYGTPTQFSRRIDMDLGAWNWLEVAKLCVGVLTPLAVAGIGIYIHRVTKRFEHLQWRSQKLIEKRLAIYDDVAPLLNDVLCYFTYVGSWADVEPATIVALKRTLDKKLYLAAPMFSPEFFAACMDFQNLCFATYNRWGQAAKLRSAFVRRQQAHNAWKPEWDAYFCEPGQISKPEDVRAAYTAIMGIFAADIGVHPEATVPSAGTVPINIR